MCGRWGFRLSAVPLDPLVQVRGSIHPNATRPRERISPHSELASHRNRVSQTQIINGDQGWMNLNGQTLPLPVAA